MTRRVLDRYIARRFAATLGLIVAAVALIILLVDYVEVLRRFSDEAGFSAVTGFKLALMRVPILIDTALPFAFLFAASPASSSWSWRGQAACPSGAFSGRVSPLRSSSAASQPCSSTPSRST